MMKLPKIVYERPDGTTTIWLSEYIEAMVQALVEVVKEHARDKEPVGWEK